MLAETSPGLLSTKVPAPALFRMFEGESTRLDVVWAVDPAATEKFAAPENVSAPLPLKIQFPLVLLEPKLSPPTVWFEPIVIVLLTAGDPPRNTASSPETQGKSVVPSIDQKLFVPHVPLPDWKPAVVDVSHVTVAATAGRKPSKAAESRRIPS